MNSILDYLKNKRLVWQATHHTAPPSVSSTGFKELDDELEGGFPEQGVMDIHTPVGVGELRLVLPNLRIRQQKTDKLLVFIAPPMQINAELLAECGFRLDQVLVIQPESSQHALWSAEQCLKSGCCHSVLLWQHNLEVHQVKRLNLAAEQGQALHVLLHHQKHTGVSLPVSLAMRLTSHPQGLQVEITKRKGGWPGQNFTLDMRAHWPTLAINPPPDNILPFPHSKVS